MGSKEVGVKLPSHATSSTLHSRPYTRVSQTELEKPSTRPIHRLSHLGALGSQGEGPALTKPPYSRLSTLYDGKHKEKCDW